MPMQSIPFFLFQISVLDITIPNAVQKGKRIPMEPRQKLKQNSLQQTVPDCTGCAACMNTCPAQAIRMPLGSDGFYRPEVDPHRCIGCHQCLNICPVLNEAKRQQAAPPAGEEPSLFYGWIQDESTRLASSSGGLFTALARYVFSQGGCVYGVASDDNLRPFHAKADNEQELQHMRGSKYLQSRVGGIMKDVRGELQRGRLVLFSGVPCQIGGLKAFLKHPYDNLITVDIICHGVPSQRVMDTYLRHQMQQTGHTTLPNQMVWRDKSSGWARQMYSTRCIWPDGQTTLTPQRKDLFMKLFLSDLFLNTGCYSCRYSGIQGKLSDLTLGDAWGIWDYETDLQGDAGVSLCITHTRQGRQILQNLPGIVLRPANPLLLRYNPSLLQPARKRPSYTLANQYLERWDGAKLLRRCHLRELPWKKRLKETWLYTQLRQLKYRCFFWKKQKK